MIQLPENFDSIFRYIVVVSQRAEQLINGAKPRAESRFQKPTLEAKDDVDAGLVPWRVLSQAEIDAQRQAIVDQFRAEVAGEGFDPEAGQPIPDVLPTGAEAAVVAEDGGERDDELARLQRLLGMVGPAGGGDEGEGEDEDADDDEEVEEVSLESEVDLEPGDDDEDDED
jgi:DNA-directed RNA polymerase subunit K/omega